MVWFQRSEREPSARRKEAEVEQGGPARGAKSPDAMGTMQRTIKVSLREALKRHGLSMRKQGLAAAVSCLERAVRANHGDGEDDDVLRDLGDGLMDSERVADLADRLVEIIEDDGVTSCVVDERAVLAAVKRFGELSGGDSGACGGLVEVEAMDAEPTQSQEERKRGHEEGAGRGSGDAEGASFVVLDAFDKIRASEGVGAQSLGRGSDRDDPDAYGSGSGGDSFSAARPLSWDEVHNKFVKRSRISCILPPASSKVAMFRERFFLIRNRVRKNRLFLKPALEHCASIGRDEERETFAQIMSAGGSNGGVLRTWCELCEISALLGCVGEHKFVLCLISAVDHEDGRVFAEDLSGKVEVDLTECDFPNNGFYTENMIVLIEGRMQTSLVFKASAVCFPPLEDDETENIKEKAAGDARSEDRGDEAENASGSEADRAVLLSDVFLDDPDCLDRLSRVLSEFGASPPALFAFMGPFLSKPKYGKRSTAPDLGGSEKAEAFASNSGKRLQKGLGDVVEMIKRHHDGLRRKSTFLFVPGPGDPTPVPQTLLPRPAILSCLTQGVEEDASVKCIFASNPCRVRLGQDKREIVLFRDDLEAKLRRHDLSKRFAPKTDPSGVTDAETPANDFERACSTVLHQSHLAPLPSFSHPIMWDYDQGLWMASQPRALVLSDCTHSEGSQLCASVGRTRCVNTGSFARQSHYAVMDGRNRVTLHTI